MEMPKHALDPATRQKIISDAVEELFPQGAIAAERARAFAAARAELDAVGDVGQAELVKAVRLAVQVVADEVKLRLRRDHWQAHAAELLPWGAKDEDRRKAAELALEGLKGLPVGMSQSEVSAKISEALEPLRKKIKLIEYGRGCVTSVLSEFHEEGLISGEDLNLQHDLEDAVEAALRGQSKEHAGCKLDGSETKKQVADMVEEIVADELDLDDEDESDEEE